MKRQERYIFFFEIPQVWDYSRKHGMDETQIVCLKNLQGRSFHLIQGRSFSYVFCCVGFVE